MKVLIPNLIGLLLVGGGKKQSTDANQDSNTPAKSTKPAKNVDNGKPEPIGTNTKTTKKLTPEEKKVVGAYEWKPPIQR